MEEIGKGHDLTISSRKKMNITGVKAVSSFDPGKIVLETILGTLTVKGDDLSVQKLDLGEGSFIVEGRLQGLWYENDGAGGRNLRGKSSWHRIFR